MDNQNNPYGPLLYLLGQFMKNGTIPREQLPQAKRSPLQEMPETEAGQKYFKRDETASRWRREEKVGLLEKFCREGYFMAKKHGHFLIGTGGEGTFIAIPGRFLLEEQPAGGVTGFTLWQPLAGGEELYDTLENLDEAAAMNVYGYWIARLDPETLRISEV